MHKLLLLTLLTFTVLYTVAQNTKRQYNFIQTRALYGTPIVYSDSLNAGDLNNNFIGSDFRFGVQANGERKLDQFLGFQQYGLGIMHIKLNNNILGNPFAIYSFFSGPIYKIKNFSLAYDLGFGIGFNFNQYDSIHNPRNDVVGSDLNAFFTGGIKANYRLNNRLSLSAGMNFLHFSNGSIKTPNKGLNMYAGDIGLAYHFARPKQTTFIPAKKVKKDIPKLIPTNEFTLAFSMGAKSILGDYGLPAKYRTSSISLDYYRHKHHISKFGAGLDYIFDGTYRTDYIESQPLNKYSFVGFHLGHELIVSKFTFVTHLGTYLWKGSPGKGLIYARVGLRYYIHKSFILNLTLKTENGLKADYIEFGLGYRLQFKK